MHQLHHRVNGVDLEPAFAKVGAVGVLVMVVLEQFTQHQKVEWRRVFGFILVIEIGIAIFVAAPVDNSAMYRPHHKMDGQ